MLVFYGQVREELHCIANQMLCQLDPLAGTEVYWRRAEWREQDQEAHFHHCSSDSTDLLQVRIWTLEVKPASSPTHDFNFRDWSYLNIKNNVIGINIY